MTDNLIDIDHRRRILIPATFGVHSAIETELRDYISRAFGHSTFSFHEVFLDHPVKWWQDFKKVKVRDIEITQPFLSRFVYRSGLTPKIDKVVLQQIKRKIRRDPNYNPLDIPLVATTQESFHLGLEKLAFSLNDSIVLQGLIEIWLAGGNGKTSAPLWKSISGWKEAFYNRKNSVKVLAPRPGRPVAVIGHLSPANVTKWYKKHVRDNLESSGKTKREREAGDDRALALLREYEIALRPWIEEQQSPPVLVAVSISSDALFWGECVSLLPGVGGEFSEETLRKYEGVANILAENVQRTFMPIMTIFETYLLENRLKNKWDECQRSDKWKSLRNSSDPLEFPFELLDLNPKWVKQKEHARTLELVGMGHDPNCDEINKLKAKFKALRSDGDSEHLFLSLLCNCFEKNNWLTKLNEVERSLAGLWAARYAVIFKELPKSTREIDKFVAAMKKIEESLVFENYLISSPAILKAIIDAMKLRHGDRGNGKPSIKTALVVGGPGSGKDSMAKLVRLFSPGYRFGPLVTLNMASFRPKEAAVPLLLGLDIFDNSRGPSVKIFSVASILGRAWKNQGPILPDPPFKHGEGLTFIFDELNSLDMDTQGALLRFLESGELLSLGDFENPIRNVDGLVVGVMNEDPFSITKARTLDRVLRDKQIFGGMLGDFLYEFFRGQRRLRDDLYFRMARGGEIVLPELRDRREDIPILFHFIVENELMRSLREPNKPKPKFEIELSTYSELMDRSLQWEGNVRELQRLAREIFEVAYGDHKRRLKSRERDSNSPLILRGAHVDTARQNLARRPQSTPEALILPTA